MDTSHTPSLKNEPLLIITGGSTGIGQATINYFLNQPQSRPYALNLSRTPPKHPNVKHLECDLNNPQARQEAIERISQILDSKSKTPLTLIHNAAHMSRGSLEQISPKMLQSDCEINLVAPLHLTQALLPYMAPGSSIIFIASTLGEKAVPGCLPYITTKHGQIGLMRALTQELAGTHIHTCAIAPGFTRTQMLQEGIKNNPELEAQIGNMVCFNRLIEPHEIAETIYFASKHPVINGATLHANLGQIER